ncbi:hypothetical protein BESB_052500 [Besnoitia besnoiti]|uniref:C3H1-type domain-containing protein n=1 Tax=Besnoitia besnoiti TaxID=94643 RepID=A0A2A9MCJ6_BESBE|nr:hypothetical protein BESB_052500 [Besnoitia besnoiti]PFH35599.1 hypothetical protein BESB_052500 [Besnoitia besnoiti]
MACGSLLSEEDLCRFRTKKCRRLVSGACEFGITRCQYSHNQYWSRRCPIYLSDRSFIRYIHVLCPHVTTKQADVGDRPSHAGLGCGRPRCVKRQAGGGPPGQQSQHSKGHGRRRGGSGSGKGSEACCCVDEWKEEIIVNTCPRGGECPFAHSTEEILYHPLFYKMIICEKYREDVCDTYYCPFIHGLAEARQPKHYKLPFTTGIDIPPLPCVTIVAKIEKKKNPLSGGTLGDTTVTAVGIDEAACPENNPESLLRQAVAAAQRQHRQLQQRSFQLCRSLMDSSESETLRTSRSAEQLAHSPATLGQGSQQGLLTRANRCGDSRSSEDDDAFACQALFDALKSLEGGDKASRSLSMPGGGRRPRAHDNGLEAVAARLTSTQQGPLSGSVWPSLPASVASKRGETAFNDPNRSVEQLTPRKVGPRLVLGGIAPGRAAALASRMSPVQLLTAAFELCGHNNRKDTIEFALNTLDDQEESVALSHIEPKEKLTEVRGTETEGEPSRRKGHGDPEPIQGTEIGSDAKNRQMGSAQLLFQFTTEPTAHPQRESDPPTELTADPSENLLASAGESLQNVRTVASVATSSASPDESSQAPGITFTSLDSSTASSPLSSPSSASRGRGPSDRAAFTTQSNANREQPCCLSAATRSPSESGAEPDISSHISSSFHSTLTATEATEATVTRPEVSADGPPEGARISQSHNGLGELEKAQERQRVEDPQVVAPVPIAGQSPTNEGTHVQSHMSQLSGTCTDCSNGGSNDKKDALVEENGPTTTVMRQDDPHTEELAKSTHETVSEEHSLHEDSCTTPNLLIDRLEQIIKALWENVWKHTPKQWSRIQCASREVSQPRSVEWLVA